MDRSLSPLMTPWTAGLALALTLTWASCSEGPGLAGAAAGAAGAAMQGPAGAAEKVATNRPEEPGPEGKATQVAAAGSELKDPFAREPAPASPEVRAGELKDPFADAPAGGASRPAAGVRAGELKDPFARPGSSRPAPIQPSGVPAALGEGAGATAPTGASAAGEGAQAGAAGPAAGAQGE